MEKTELSNKYRKKRYGGKTPAFIRLCVLLLIPSFLFASCNQSQSPVTGIKPTVKKTQMHNIAVESTSLEGMGHKYNYKLLYIAKNGKLYLKESEIEVFWNYEADRWELSENNARTVEISATGTDNTSVFINKGKIFVIKSNGTLWQLHEAPDTKQYSAEQVEVIERCVKVCVGKDSVTALTSDGLVYSWGSNDHGQLGDGTFDDRETPALVPGLSEISDISGIWNHYMALDKTGNVYTWGSNSFGKIGDGTYTQYDVIRDEDYYDSEDSEDSEDIIINSEIDYTKIVVNNDRNSVYRVEGLSGVVQISAGAAWSIVLLDDGTVFEWGGSKYVLHMPDPYDTKPKQLTSIDGITMIAAGKGIAFALSDKGDLWTWRYIEHMYGIAGIGGDSKPYKLGFQAKIKEIIPDDFSIIVTQNNKIWMGQPGKDYYNEVFMRIQ